MMRMTTRALVLAAVGAAVAIAWRWTAASAGAAGLQHAGSGDELESARAPVFVGAAPRRIATIAVSTSASPESRATAARGDILGRPGVSPLRYTANVTVDPATF